MKGFSIYGSGTLHGRGASWWTRGNQRPHLLQIDHSANVRIMGLNFRSGSDHPHVEVATLRLSS